MKSYKFTNAKLNVVQYIEPTDKESATRLELDETLSGFVNKYGLHRAVFQGTNGFYLCTPAVSDNFVSNPFKLDVKAIKAVSLLLAKVADGNGLNLVGWNMRESTRNGCTITLHVCDRNYDVADGELPSIVVSMDTFKVIDDCSQIAYGFDTVRAIVKNVKYVLESLARVNLPIHLFEVSLFGAKYSEESYDEEEFQTCVWEEMGEFSNTNHVVEGLSVITPQNGFECYEDLEGKYAMVVVV